MAIYWPTPGFKGRTFKLCVLIRQDFNFCICSSPLQAQVKQHGLIHPSKRTFTCIECGLPVKSPSTWRDTWEFTLVRNPYFCPKCDATIHLDFSLEPHTRIHTNERPFLWAECDASFRHSSSLTKHVRIHTGESPFACEECYAAFRGSSQLLEHLRNQTE